MILKIFENLRFKILRISAKTITFEFTFNKTAYVYLWCTCEKLLLTPAIEYIQSLQQNTRKRCEIYPKLTRKTPEWRLINFYSPETIRKPMIFWWFQEKQKLIRRCFCVFIGNFENVLILFLLFLLMILNRQMFALDIALIQFIFQNLWTGHGNKIKQINEQKNYGQTCFMPRYITLSTPTSH